MKPVLALILSILVFNVHAENNIKWERDFQLQLSDFKSPATQIGRGTLYSVQPAATFSFSFYMSAGEFMFTKNFNEKVDCSFQQDAAMLIAPDSATAADLLEFARFDFDLCELYARKFRKELHDRKGAFSNADFFRPIYDEVQKEFSVRHATAAQQTDLGRNRELLAKLHGEVLAEIDQLADFCKSCKAAKKKK
jgi:hypothetical protein